MIFTSHPPQSGGSVTAPGHLWEPHVYWGMSDLQLCDTHTHTDRQTLFSHSQSPPFTEAQFRQRPLWLAATVCVCKSESLNKSDTGCFWSFQFLSWREKRERERARAVRKIKTLFFPVNSRCKGTSLWEHLIWKRRYILSLTDRCFLFFCSGASRSFAEDLMSHILLHGGAQ